MRSKDGDEIKVGDVAETIMGLKARVLAVDEHGYAKLAGQVSTRYVPHLSLFKVPADSKKKRVWAWSEPSIPATVSWCEGDAWRSVDADLRPTPELVE